jgi:hypothetical protein
MSKTKVQEEPNHELLLQQLKQRLLAQGIRPQIIDTAKIIKVTDHLYLFWDVEISGGIKGGFTLIIV